MQACDHNACCGRIFSVVVYILLHTYDEKLIVIQPQKENKFRTFISDLRRVSLVVYIFEA